LAPRNPLRALQLRTTKIKARNPKKAKNRSARSKSAVGAGNRRSRLSFLHRNSPRWGREEKFFGVPQLPTSPSSTCHQDRGEKNKIHEKGVDSTEIGRGSWKTRKVGFLTFAIIYHQDGVVKRSSLASRNPLRTLQVHATRVEVKKTKNRKNCQPDLNRPWELENKESWLSHLRDHLSPRWSREEKSFGVSQPSYEPSKYMPPELR
jgi:hypothetical protein